MGLNASKEHLLAPGDIPVVQIDRGGQVTFHGPGQLMVYPLIDIRRAGIGVRTLVTALEQSVVDLAAEFDVDSGEHVRTRPAFTLTAISWQASDCASGAAQLSRHGAECRH